MVIRPYDRHRVTKTSGSNGTYTEALGTANLIYGTVVVHKGETNLIVSEHDDVKVGEDILVIQGGQYRVIGLERTSHAPRILLKLERVKKPIAIQKP